MAETLNLRGTLKGCVLARRPALTSQPTAERRGGRKSSRLLRVLGCRMFSSMFFFPRVQSTPVRKCARGLDRDGGGGHVVVSDSLADHPPALCSLPFNSHEGWVTSIATPLDTNSDILLSSSRDKTGAHTHTTAWLRAHPFLPAAVKSTWTERRVGGFTRVHLGGERAAFVSVGAGSGPRGQAKEGGVISRAMGARAQRAVWGHEDGFDSIC